MNHFYVGGRVFSYEEDTLLEYYNNAWHESDYEVNENDIESNDITLLINDMIYGFLPSQVTIGVDDFNGFVREVNKVKPLGCNIFVPIEFIVDVDNIFSIIYNKDKFEFYLSDEKLAGDIREVKGDANKK